MTHRDYMREALKLAQKAADLGEVPVGAVIVKENAIVGRGYNTRESGKTALGHAEIMAIADACKNVGGWRLDGCTIYVTMEPCPMCAGAIINSRISRVVYSLIDFKMGAFGGKTDLSSMGFNHSPEIIVGICEEESAKLIEEFFKKLRDK